MYDLTLNAVNKIPFVMVDAAGAEVAGLGTALTIALSVNGGTFAPSAGSKAELSSGWYLYTTTAAECATAGPLALKITAAGCVQQNLVCSVGDPWHASLPGGYTAGEAGYIVGRLATLDVSAPVIISLVDGGALTIISAVTFDPAAITGLTVPANWSTAYYTLKTDRAAADSTALAQIKITSTPALTDGLIRLNGAASTAAWGTLALTSSAATIVIADHATALLAKRNGVYWDIKTLNADGTSDLICSGTAEIRLTPTATIA